MLVFVIILLQVVQLVLLFKMRKGGTFVYVTQKHVYIPAPPKKRKKPVQQIEEDSDYEEY